MTQVPPVRYWQFYVALVMFAATLSAAIAEDEKTEQPVLVAKRDLAVVQTPRRGLFCQHGKELGKLASGAEVFHYEFVTSFCGLAFPIEYVKLEYRMSDGQKAWAYVRRKENDNSDRFSTKSK